MAYEDDRNVKQMTRRDLLRLGAGGLGATSLMGVIENSINPQAEESAAKDKGAFRPRISMSGSWKFQLDPTGIGEAERWFAQPEKIRGTLHVPGCWQAQGYGKPTGTLRHHYIGSAWYLTEVNIPNEWREKKIDLVIKGAFTYTAIYVNGKLVGQHAGFITPFREDVTPFINTGLKNIISLKVANAHHHEDPIDMARHHYREPTGCLNYIAMWGGLYEEVYLEAHETCSIRRAAITTDIRAKTAQLLVGVINESSSNLNGRVLVIITNKKTGAVYHKTKQVSLTRNSRADVLIKVKIPDARLWSPDEPNIYHARIRMLVGARTLDEVEEHFGMREIRVEGTKLLLNGNPLYLRGYGDDSVYVISGTPPTSKEVFRERLRLVKSFGFNAVRFHSWTPTTDFFDVADEVGILIMAELSVESALYFLPNREFLRRELIRIIQTYRNHPSWFSLALGNEFNVRWLRDEQKRTLFLEKVRQFVELAKQMDPTRLILSNDGYLVKPTDIASLYHGFSMDLPTIKHEFGVYYCSLPDVSLIDRFTGVFEPLWLQAKKDWLQSRGMLESYPHYLQNSWRLLQTARKANIENLRRLDEIIGYQYWLMTDFPAGTPEGAAWEWGICNYFWEPKGIKPSEMSVVNSGVLPLIGLEVDDRTMWAEHGKDADIFISNYGGEAIVDGELKWEVRKNGQKLAGDRFLINSPLGEVTRVGNISIRNIPISEACKLELTVSVSFKSRTYRNEWSLWAFPKRSLMRESVIPVFSSAKCQAISRHFPFVKRLPGKDKDLYEGLLISSDLNADVVRALKGGGRVLVLAAPNRFDQQSRANYFPPTGGAIGVRLPHHPALGKFPHDGFPDLQFFNLLENCTQFNLEGLEGPITNLDVIVDGIRSTRGKSANEISRFALLFEANVGPGRLLVSMMNVIPRLDDECPEAIFLLDQLIQYATSQKFRPTTSMSPKQFSDLVVPYVRMIHAL